MDAFACHHVRQRDTGGENPYPNFAALRLRNFLFDHSKCIGTAVVIDDDAPVLHGTLLSLPGARGRESTSGAMSCCVARFARLRVYTSLARRVSAKYR